MTQVNMLEAKANFSRLIRMLENKQEDEIIITGDNHPVAKIVLFKKTLIKGSGSQNKISFIKHRSL